MKQAENNQAEEESTKKKKVKVVPINFESTITRDGRFQMEFNQDMVVPFDFKSRRLQSDLSYDQFDVERNLIEMDFGEEQENVENLELTEWNERNIEIKINFKDPLSVTEGESTSFNIKNPSLFMSAASGESISNDQTSFSKTLPKQLPKDVNED